MGQFRIEAYGLVCVFLVPPPPPPPPHHHHHRRHLHHPNSDSQESKISFLRIEEGISMMKCSILIVSLFRLLAGK